MYKGRERERKRAIEKEIEKAAEIKNQLAK